MVDQLREFKEVRRGWLGVRIQQVSDEIAESLSIKPARGALVAGIDEKGPAKPAGIEPGDVIVRFDGKDVKEMRDLPRSSRILRWARMSRWLSSAAARKKKDSQAWPSGGRETGRAQYEEGRGAGRKACREEGARA